MLDVNNLSVSFATNDGTVNAVNGVSFALRRGETLGIVGESGSGKSQLAFALLGLLAKNGTARGSAKFNGTELISAPLSVLNTIRSNHIAMVFQDPMTSLNPYMRVSDQMMESLIHHKGMSRAQALAECVRMLDAVKIPDAKGRIRLYPHEFSGGMRQRVMIAMSLLCKPDILIADEPTTALDVTVQAQIMHLLRDIQRDFGMATILITPDLGVIAGFCQEVIVLYGGQVMEQGNAEAIFYTPSHPYTAGLLAAVPRLEGGDAPMLAIPGAPPNMARLPVGCPFTERCAMALPHCGTVRPVFGAAAHDAQVLRACHLNIEDVTQTLQRLKAEQGAAL
jgi:oligopeptide transport system ATP-binding protein